MSKHKQSNYFEKIIFFTNAQQVLAFFLSHPSGVFYDREVARQTGVSRAGANFALRDLAKQGILHREKKGRMVFYALVAADPLVRQLKIVNTTVQLRPLLQTLKQYAVRVVLFGSAAKGDNDEASDIDLLVLSREKEKVMTCLHPYIARMKLQPVVHSSQEWASLEQASPVFVHNVEQGLTLWESHESGI